MIYTLEKAPELKPPTIVSEHESIKMTNQMPEGVGRIVFPETFDNSLNMGEQQKPNHEQKRCNAQTKIDPISFNSCGYKIVFPKLNVHWIEKNHLNEPGKDELRDRKIAFFKKHPDAYKEYKAEIKAGIYYHSPISWVWEKVNNNECNSAYNPKGYGSAPPYWNCQTGNTFYGGIQMNKEFEAGYNPIAKTLWGHASNWPIAVQKYTADKAYINRGLTPWPSSYAELGSYPASTAIVQNALKKYAKFKAPYTYAK
jgi:hypothetical protein